MQNVQIDFKTESACSFSLTFEMGESKLILCKEGTSL